MDRLIKHFSYSATWAGLARIVLWTLLFLFLIGRAFPVDIPDEIPFSGHERIAPVLTFPDDNRLSLDSAPCPGDPCIAWIGDSSSILYPPDKDVTTASLSEVGLLPEYVMKNIIGDPGVSLYLRISLRLLETYTLLADALARRPDLVVVTLNPIWIFTDRAVFKGNAHFNKASVLWAKSRETWPWLKVLSSPGNKLWAAAGQHVPVVKNSLPYKRYLKDQFGWQKAAQSEPAAEKGKLPHISENSLILWILVDRLKGDYGFMIDENSRMLNNLWYREIIKMAETDAHGLNREILDNIMSLLRESGVPALVYLAPLDDKDIQADPETWKKYQDIVSAVEQIAKDNSSKNIKFAVQIPPDIKNSVSFKQNDNIHMSDPGHLDDWLASEIDAMIDTMIERETK